MSVHVSVSFICLHSCVCVTFICLYLICLCVSFSVSFKVMSVIFSVSVHSVCACGVLGLCGIGDRLRCSECVCVQCVCIGDIDVSNVMFVCV